MIICLNTNVLLQARARGHAYFPILDAWVAGKFTLAVSTGILLEYEKDIARMSGREHWHKFARLMDYVELTTGALLRGKSPSAMRKIMNTPAAAIKIPFQVKAELLHGAAKSSKPVEGRRAVLEFIHPFQLILPSDEILEQYVLI